MGRGASIKQALERAVELRLVADAVTDVNGRRRLTRVLRGLHSDIGVSVPKTRAAAVLGVSVPALEKWISRGTLPVVRRPGSSREEVDADALLDLAEQVKRLRETGVTRSVLAAAFENLAREGKPRRRLRPNMSPRLLRADFVNITPADRLRTGVELSHAGSILLARGNAARGHPAETAPSRFFDLLRVLCEHEVEFVVIGGLAVNLHGYERLTRNVSMVPEPSETNRMRLSAALIELRASPHELAAFGRGAMPVGLDTRLGRLDVRQEVDGVDGYGELRERAVREELEEIGHPIWIAGFDDLITMKREAGRDLDLVDITALRMAHGLEE